ncbi:MAG: hypothetical protein JSW72_01360 [Candidatus Bathyarchaeota archaeon]|nr:MAG: hypothetical protein JSW72_01360 [Candidatus Bathyarchaeota archaeon]
MKRETGKLIGFVLVLASIKIFIIGGTIQGIIIANNEFEERLKSEGFEVLRDAKLIDSANETLVVGTASEFIELARGKTVYFTQVLFYVLKDVNATFKRAYRFAPNSYWRLW